MSRVFLIASQTEIDEHNSIATPDGKDPTPSRIVPHERESEAQEPPTPGTSDPVDAIDDTVQLENRLIGEYF